MSPDDLPCPCGGAQATTRSGRPAARAPRYTDCCGRYHAGPLHLQAPDAASLMRSRYSAYVLDRIDYLLDTWHPSTRPATLAANEAGLRWLGLELRRHVPLDAEHAQVEFIARSKLGGRAWRLHELSCFVREGGRWLYVDGDVG